MDISKEIRERLLTYQQNEITENRIYMKLAGTVDSPENRRILEQIAADELRHYRVWQKYTQQEVSPNSWEVWKYYLISRVFGFTFGVKLMERGEEDAQERYGRLPDWIPEAGAIAQEEYEHESALLELLDEERLRYIGSIVLGLNDALVELTGALAGLTFALQNTRLVALTGLITGIAAALSTAASEYLATKSEKNAKNPVRASIYTGVAYLATVFVLILPYLLLQNFYLCLACTLGAAILIIGFFSYYVSVAQEVTFKKRFLEMSGLSLGVATLSFLIGLVVRAFLGVEI